MVPRNRSLEGDISFHFHHSAPCFLEAFDMGDVLSPLHSPYAALKAMQFPPQQKPGKLQGLPLNCSKKYPLPVNGCRPCPATGAVAFCRVSIAGRIALPLRSAMSEL